MMSLFEKNIRAIRKKEPELAERLKTLPPTDRITRGNDENGKTVLTVKGPDGSGALTLPDIGGPILNDMADELAGARMVALLGFGSGRLLAEIVNRTCDQTFILLAEPDIDLFAATLRETDMSEILDVERVSLGVGEKTDTAIIARAEREFSVFNLDDFTVMENPWSSRIYSSYFRQARRILDHLKRIGEQNIMTMATLGGEWQRNILENLPAVLASPPSAFLFGKYRDIPAIIVCAGPSLTGNLPWLSALKGRLLLIAVDTAVRPMLAEGIMPDIVVAVDSQMENYAHLVGLSMPGVLFAINPVVQPALVAERDGSIVFMSYADPLFEWVEDIIGERGEVRAGGSVSTSAFDLAFKMGCSPIIFVGQDMAFTGGESHAQGSTYQQSVSFDPAQANDKTYFADDGNGFYTVPDIFGKPTFTSHKMDTWRRWFELVIGREEGLFALNATQGGLPIKGAQTVSLCEVMARYASGKAIASPLTLAKKSADRLSYKMMMAPLTCARDSARKVKSICGKGVKIVEQAKNAEPDYKALDNLARELMEQKLFARLNRWSVEKALDSVDKAGSLKAYQLLFMKFYGIAVEFEKNTAKTLTAIKNMEKAGNRP